MTGFRIQHRAAAQLDEIYCYTRAQWGQVQAEQYLRALFASFKRAAQGGVPSRPVPAEFGVDGYFYRCRKHFVYWKWLESGEIGIVAVLHERMHQIERFQQDLDD